MRVASPLCLLSLPFALQPSGFGLYTASVFSNRTNWPLNPNRLTQELEERRRRGLPVLDLTESNPTRAGFTFNPEEILDALADPRSLNYEPDPCGLRIAREAVATYYAERGIAVDPDRIFLTASTSEAYAYVFRLLANPHDAVLVPRPSYPLFDFLARLNDVEIRPYPLFYSHGWQIEVATAEAIVAAGVTGDSGVVLPQTRAILVVNPNNPTGSFLHEDELAGLVECCDRRGLALIADEVFADYGFEPEPGARSRVRSVAATNEVLTFTLSGLSKISALPQMKLAWIVLNGPPLLLSSALERLEIIADTYLSVSVPLAHALPRLLEMRHSLQPQVRRRVIENLALLDAALPQDSPLGRLETEGGWYAVLRVPTIMSDDDWAVELLRDEGVLLHPGHFYDFASEGHLVISLLPKPGAFRESVHRIVEHVQHASE